MPEAPSPPRLAVFASGGGSNLQALIDAHERGDLPAPVALVIVNKAKAGARERARKHGIPEVHVNLRGVDLREQPDPDSRILELLRAHEIDVVVLAGWLALVSPRILEAFPDRVVNIHPGPLPRFGGKGMYGLHVHRAVLEAGVEQSGPTVHLVDPRYDEGPVLAHIPVPVAEGDTPESLQQRVLRAEHALYWRVIRDRFCEPA
ncbi:phosphoribosylglycinamide formyltransferase [Pseudenhygromyxa sp. WMMC2535]|uniref:phosphoribosylglycinamide formyltransferase n=1 Tax=Pseudenhygromyxa sp. WMMC2535 TaxID=2712867 RepID=UPI00155270C8|nr:phosphoribosylglycinamide formyltransferase [Pseudenhygromyxa sp. WMMC2535]NVB42022.1 phosphoribosylglycinamide formyltransferase [Pseudenhygromyxa sp. WMMC2535]